jgi:hypothetical protein
MADPLTLRDTQQRAAAWLAEAHARDIPPQVLVAARLTLADWLGVALGGSSEAAARIAHAQALAMAGKRNGNETWRGVQRVNARRQILASGDEIRAVRRPGHARDVIVVASVNAMTDKRREFALKRWRAPRLKLLP